MSNRARGVALPFLLLIEGCSNCCNIGDIARVCTDVPKLDDGVLPAGIGDDALLVDGTNDRVLLGIVDGVLLGIVDGLLFVDRHGTDDNDTVLLAEDGLRNSTGISVTSSAFSTDAANSEVSSSEISPC